MQTEPEMKPVGNTGSNFAAFVTRYPDVAVVSIYRRPSRYEIDFSRTVSSYETLSNGASESARREIRRLEDEAA